MESKALRALFWALLLLAAVPWCPLPAHAGVLRPNAIDRRVSAISPAQLLAQPASALVDPDRQTAARRYERLRVAGFLVMVLVQIAALAYFWQSGWAARARDRLRRRVRSEFAVRWIVAALLVLVARLAALLPSLYLFRLDRAWGLSNELARTWSADWLTNLVLAMIFVGIAVAAVLWLADRTHQWYLYTAAGIFAVAVLIAYANPFVIAPIYNSHERLRPPIASPLEQLTRRAGDPGIPIVVENRSRRTQTAEAAAIGIGSSDEIVLADTLIAGATPPELLFYTADELGHVAHHDTLRLALFDAMLFVLGTALAVFVADRVRFRRDDDAVSRLALVGALLGVVYLVAVPFHEAASRASQSQADGYAIALTQDRAAAVRAMVRSADQEMTEICPSAVEMLYFSSAPPIARRVSAFNGVPSRCE